MDTMSARGTHGHRADPHPQTSQLRTRPAPTGEELEEDPPVDFAPGGEENHPRPNESSMALEFIPRSTGKAC